MVTLPHITFETLMCRKCVLANVVTLPFGSLHPAMWVVLTERGSDEIVNIYRS